MTGSPCASMTRLARGGVTFERQRRVLDDADAVVGLLQQAVDLLPAGADHETPVDKDGGACSIYDGLLREVGETAASLDRAIHRGQSCAWLPGASHRGLSEEWDAATARTGGRDASQGAAARPRAVAAATAPSPASVGPSATRWIFACNAMRESAKIVRSIDDRRLSCSSAWCGSQM